MRVNRSAKLNISTLVITSSLTVQNVLRESTGGVKNVQERRVGHSRVPRDAAAAAERRGGSGYFHLLRPTATLFSSFFYSLIISTTINSSYCGLCCCNLSIIVYILYVLYVFWAFNRFLPRVFSRRNRNTAVCNVRLRAVYVVDRVYIFDLDHPLTSQGCCQLMHVLLLFV